MIKEVINVPKWLITNFRPKTKLQCFVFARQHCCHYRQVWFQQPGTSASPTSQLFAHFRLSGSDAWWRAAKMEAVGSAHFSKMLFRNLRVTSRTLHPCFFTVYDKGNISSLYRDSSPKNEKSVINYTPSCCSKHARPSLIFGTQIKIFLMHSESSLTRVGNWKSILIPESDT